MKKIISILLSVFLAVACFSFVGCGNSKYSYWQTEGRKDAEENLLLNVAELTFSSVKVSQVWINVSDLKPEETSIQLDLYGTSSTAVKKISAKITRSEISKSAKKQGWINVFSDVTSKNCSKINIQVSDTLKFNEVVLVNEDGELIKLTFSKGGVKMDTSENIYTEDQLKKLDKSDMAYSENPAYNIVDEQDKFPTEYIEEYKNKAE